MDDVMIEEPIESAPLADWIPPQSVVRHSGAPLEPKFRFFEPPPPEIGEVRSAETNLNQGVSPWSLNSRLFVVAVVSALAAFGTSWICDVWRVKGPTFVNLITTGAALLGALGAWLGTQFRKTCSYVGSHGVARFTCQGSTGNISQREVYVFDPSHELRTTTTMHYHNGVYTGTHYQYIWTTLQNAKAFKLGGSHNSKKDEPPAGNAFHLARAAEDAWSDFRLNAAFQQLEAGQEVVFRGSGRDHIRVGPGYLVIVQGKQEHPVAIQDLGNIDVEQGTLRFFMRDAKKGFLGIGRSGIYSMPYGSIGNARVLLYLTLSMLRHAEQMHQPDGGQGGDELG